MKHFPILILSLLIHTAYAQNPPQAKEKQFTKTNLSFIENKGQITDQYGKPRHDVQYKVAGKGVSVFVGNGQLHYQFSKAEPKPIIIDKKHPAFGKMKTPDSMPTHYTMYRLDMQLSGANPHAQPVAEDKQAYYENYHTTALNTGNEVVNAYSKITYKNIYRNIDWVLYIKDNKLEYDFIVRPGGNVNDIKIKYNGATDIAHTEGNIKITTPMGDVSEQKLYAYEQSTGKPIAAQFNYRKNTIGFSIPGRHCEVRSNLKSSLRDTKQSTLVIDPTLAWGTYFGGAGTNICMGDACDNAGNIFICGATKSTANIATTGAYQTVYNGAEDAFLAKFNSSGSLLWATYYGGEDQDYANSVACDNFGNAYITGLTYSSANIATTGSYQTTLNGLADGFLAKFNDAGALQWATYYGNNGGVGNCIILDMSNNIYICGGAGSKNDIATLGSYQDTLSGYSNAFLAKFTYTGSIIWATYFGLSTGSSGAIACICDKEQNVYITGIAYDTGIAVTPHCYQGENAGGGQDCFIAKFDSSCHLLWSTYYGGDSIDNPFGIACDDSLNVYITGFTNSSNGIATSGAYQTTFGGGYTDAFVVKFNDTGALQWGTYYGGSNDDEGQGIAYDGLGNIYITGYTESTNNIATPGSYQPADMGSSDVFLARFSNSGALSWATYYGGVGPDDGLCVTSDGIGNEYIAGSTGSPGGIATAGCYQSDVAGGFLAKFDTAATNVKVITPIINTVHLFPSPNNGNFVVNGEFTGAISSVSIEIRNVSGQVVYSDVTLLQNGALSKKINILNAVPGIYMMQLSAGDETKTIKFLLE